MRVTQRFGRDNTAIRLLPLYAKYGLVGHNGIDVVTEDHKLYSPVMGEVIYLAPDYSDGYGAYIKIKSGDCYHYFCHLDYWCDELKVGAQVSVGQYLGVIGGSSLGVRFYFGAHLHYGVKPVQWDEDNGYRGYIDPERFVDIRLLEKKTIKGRGEQ